MEKNIKFTILTLILFVGTSSMAETVLTCEDADTPAQTIQFKTSYHECTDADEADKISMEWKSAGLPVPVVFCSDLTKIDDLFKGKLITFVPASYGIQLRMSDQEIALRLFRQNTYSLDFLGEQYLCTEEEID